MDEHKENYNVRAYKHWEFEKWAKKQKISDTKLTEALNEIERGLIDADLGGGLYKKRIAMSNKGKSDGVRTLLAYKMESTAFFIHGFAKNQQANITPTELKQMKMYAKLLLGFNPVELEKLIESGEFIKIVETNHEQ